MRFAQTTWPWAMFALAGLLLGCDASDQAAGAAGAAAAKDSRDVAYAGMLTEATVPDILARLKPGAERLIITSTGGEGDASIELGRAVRERNIEVVVRGYCFSGCAHFVFAPARRKHVEDNAVVGFHGTATARQELFERSGRADIAGYYAGPAAREQALYAEAGLAKELLVRPLIEVSPVCYAKRDPALESAVDVAIVTRATFYVPTRASLDAWSVTNLSGFWPETGPAFSAALATLPRSFNMNFRMEAVHGSFADRLPAIEACPPDVSTQ